MLYSQLKIRSFMVRIRMSSCFKAYKFKYLSLSRTLSYAITWPSVRDSGTPFARPFVTCRHSLKHVSATEGDEMHCMLRARYCWSHPWLPNQNISELVMCQRRRLPRGDPPRARGGRGDCESARSRHLRWGRQVLCRCSVLLGLVDELCGVLKWHNSAAY